MEVSKTEFAALAKVSAGRVSQWIAEGKIGPGEMLGEGRSAKIRVEPAFEKLKLRLDSGQRLGNGLGTNLSAAKPETPASESDELDRKIKQAKLETSEAQLRKLKEDENYRKGIYVLASDASAEAGKLVANLLQHFESGIVEMAIETAALHKLPQRDEIHRARTRFRELRVKISATLANDAAGLAPILDEETA